ncbi:MAG: ARPP-1 family domain-containing protein [Hyphomicrobiaceae bacterium]
MHLRLAAPIVFAASSLGIAALTAAAPDPAPTITAPVTHENLAVYLVRGRSAGGPAPATLEEALARGSVTVHETGNVRELKIENTGSEPVFIQFGDLVKGGRQDRVLTTSLLIPPRSGQIAIGAYCIEQGRWAKRGAEDAGKFSASNAQLFSRPAKVAIARAPLTTPEPRPAQGIMPPAEARPAGARDVNQAPHIQARPAVEPPQQDAQRILQGIEPRSPSGQGKVWESVSTAQLQLAARLAAPMASERSKTSLQLTLENERLQKAQAAFVTALDAKALADDDVIGVVVAINGAITGGDLYPSNGLFRKMWPKLVRAAATEALANPAKDMSAPPSIADVEKFLAAAESGETSTRALADIAEHETRESADALKVEARTSDGRWIHRNFLAVK